MEDQKTVSKSEAETENTPEQMITDATTNRPTVETRKPAKPKGLSWSTWRSVLSTGIFRQVYSPERGKSFRTRDNVEYYTEASGAITRMTPKAEKKAVRKARRQSHAANNI
jgi:hypothetical protein